MSWCAKRFARQHKLTRHHNVAQSKHGNGHGRKGNEDYLVMLSAEHHALFHKLFGTATLLEAADILVRLDRLRRSLT